MGEYLCFVRAPGRGYLFHEHTFCPNDPAWRPLAVMAVEGGEGDLVSALNASFVFFSRDSNLKLPGDENMPILFDWTRQEMLAMPSELRDWLVHGPVAPQGSQRAP